MKSVNSKRILSAILVLVLVAAMALSLCACGSDGSVKLPLKDGKTYGKGNTSFALVVTDMDAKTTNVTIKTDKTTVGAALLELGIIDGDPSDWGLYVTTVNGIVLDWDKDQAYWAFYIGDEYAMTGVDATDITAGTTYALVATKG